MSTIDEVKSDQTRPSIIRLKVEGARNTVNTLSDRQTKRGVSLICPFPALEVNLPATFGSTAEGKMKSGTIHRIGVEDDPETGLPRLRLSIRSDDTRSTVIEQPSISLIDESSRKSEAKKSDSCDVPTEINLDDHSFEISSDEGDPQWVNCDEIPLPEEFLERAKTRRRHKMVRKAVYLTLLVVIAAGGFVLERTGTISLDDVRSYVAGLSINTKGPKKAAEKNNLETYKASNEIFQEMIEEETLGESNPSQMATEDQNADGPPEELFGEMQSEVEETPQPVQLASVKLDGADDAMLETNLEAEAKEEDSTNSKVIEDAITVMLPTRWPVEYASGYRIRDPNGVVIDVPGGLVKKEGWLEAAEEYPMIRSIKSIQRETGARFVVYVKGELPRFMTSPKGSGVALRLYDLAGSDLSSQEVAMAD